LADPYGEAMKYWQRIWWLVEKKDEEKEQRLEINLHG